MCLKGHEGFWYNYLKFNIIASILIDICIDHVIHFLHKTPGMLPSHVKLIPSIMTPLRVSPSVGLTIHSANADFSLKPNMRITDRVSVDTSSSLREVTIMLIGLARLKKFFADTSVNGIVKSRHNCIDCGIRVEVEVHKSSGGYGFLGGALYELGDCLYARCTDCYESDPDLNRNLESLEKVRL